MGAGSPYSFEKFNYALRPAKQVERKVLIEILQRLSVAGYFMPEYTYLGMGSVYYADYVLFHKYLLIDRMVCAESRPIKTRMTFNKPYEFIQLDMRLIGDLIPEMDYERRYLVWVDYDSPLDSEGVRDLEALAYRLSPGSILIITVESDVERLLRREDNQLGEDARKEVALNRLKGDLGRVYGKRMTKALLTPYSLPIFHAEVLRNICRGEAGKRSPKLSFIQLFNYTYADGAGMLTFGGIIDNPEAHDKLADAGVWKDPLVQSQLTPLKLSVPPLTTREKLWLDQHLEAAFSTVQKKVGLRNDQWEDFKKFSRHYPTYVETIV